LRKATISFAISVCLSVILSVSARVLVRLPLGGFLLNLMLILGTFFENLSRNSEFG